jgi:hypothetical protein
LSLACPMGLVLALYVKGAALRPPFLFKSWMQRRA